MLIVKFVKTEDISEKINALFESEKQKLMRLLPDAQIEHVGGTSVPGAISKGDLDINVQVEAENFQKSVEILKQNYQINQPGNWKKGFASFKDDSRDLGVQLTAIGSGEDHFVAQRDYLIGHPEAVAELNALKKQFEGKPMDDYRKAKSNFYEKLNKLINEDRKS